MKQWAGVCGLQCAIVAKRIGRVLHGMVNGVLLC